MAVIDTIRWLMKTMQGVTTEVFHFINRKQTVEYPYITFTNTSTPEDEIRDIHRFELNLFDYGTSREALMVLEESIRQTFDRQSFIEEDVIIHSRKGIANDIPTGDDTIQRRDIELIIKTDRRNVNG